MICFSMFASSFHLLATKQWDKANIALSILFLIILVYILSRIKNPLVFLKQSLFRLDKKVLAMWSLFSISVVISEIYNRNYSESLILLVIIPLLFFILIPAIFDDKSVGFKMAFLSLLPYVLYVLYLAIFTKNRFTSNTPGLLIFTFLISIFYFEDYFSPKPTYLSMYLFQFITALLGFAIFRVKSRTSLVGFLGLYFINLVFNLYKSYKRKDSPQLKKYFIVYSSVLVISISIIILNINKFAFVLNKWGSGISTHRFDIWKYTIFNSNLFGHGYSFYISNDMLGPHNVFISLIGYTGILSLLTFLMFLFFVLKQHFLIASRDNYQEMKATLLIGISFIIYGSFEGMIHYPVYAAINYLIFNHIGSIIHNDNIVELKWKNSNKWVNFLFWLFLILVFSLSVYYITTQGNISYIIEKFSKYLLR